MNKKILAICFMAVFLTHPAAAAVTEMNDMDKPAPNRGQPIDTSLPDGMPDPNNLDEVISFFKERFRSASVNRVSPDEDLNRSESMNIQHSAEYIQQMQEQNKSVFEKIYDNAMGRISGTTQPDGAPSETVFYQMNADQVQNPVDDLQAPDVPVVNVTLPTGNKIIAPAREHIPYLLSSYELLPTGLIQVQEDVTVVANGQKLKNGLIKVIDKNSVSRAGVRKKVDAQLLSVTVNGQEIPYVLEEIGDKIYIKPKQEYILTPGVYTFSFKYLLDRKLWYYDDFSEFYVDVTGSYLNMVITSANAIVSVPDGRNFMSQNVIVGKEGRFSDRRAVAASLDGNALGFASVTPLLPGEGMHLLVALDKNVFLEPDFDRRFAWFITDYGDILFTFAGLAAILVSYLLSLRYIRRRKALKKTTLSLPASSLRYLMRGNFDRRAFVAGLLELVRKNFIDIRQQDDTVLLIKKTDNLKTLSRSEKKAVNSLFPGKESVLQVSPIQALRFNRAMNAMEKGAKTSARFMSLKLNIGYLFFSIGMLVLSEVAVSLLAVNPLQMAFILFSGTLTIAFYIWMYRRKFKNKILNLLIKVLAVVFILFAVLLISIYIKLISAVFIAAMVYCIFDFEALFSKRSGLLKSKYQEVEDLKKYLISSADTINKSQLFYNRQAYIFALEVEKNYSLNEYNQRFYKLDLAEKVLSMI